MHPIDEITTGTTRFANNAGNEIKAVATELAGSSVAHDPVVAKAVNSLNAAADKLNADVVALVAPFGTNNTGTGLNR